MWGEFGTLGLRGWAGGDGGCQCCEFEVRPADIDFGSQISTGFSFKRVIFARPNEGDFEAVGWVWGAWALRVGWCGAVLGVWARLSDFDLGLKLTLGFHLNGHGG